MVTIVAGIDQHVDRAVNQVETITTLFGGDADVHLVHWQDLTLTMAEYTPEATPTEEVESVTRAADLLEADGVDVTLVDLEHKRFDTAAEAILETAAEVDADVVSVAGRKRTKTGKVLFGSTTQAVILESTYPVVTTSLSGDR